MRAPFGRAGDQPGAIEECVRLLREEARQRVCLRGATGTGKTFVMANVVAELGRPTLVVVPNKTLAAQVARELRAYLGETHRVELFVSHFSVYVPESFSNGRYTEKRSAVDADLDALRHRATRALVEPGAPPVIVASVSCLYGLGLPSDYVAAALTLEPGAPAAEGGIEGVVERLKAGLLYEQAPPPAVSAKLMRGQYRLGDVPDADGCVALSVWPPYLDAALELRVRGDDGVVVSLQSADGGEAMGRTTIWPRMHHITPAERLEKATESIAEELEDRLRVLRASGCAVEADRLEQRTNADLLLLRELGFCPGAEHYSRHLRGARPGESPVTLLDYLAFTAGELDPSTPQKREWLLVADESHVMLPQLRAMYGGDRSRKVALVDAGYRLPSALDNRPLTGDEFWTRVPQALLVSATPGDVETDWVGEDGVVDMVVRPSGVLDPPVRVVPKEDQLGALASAVSARAAVGECSLVCALTKADTEDLTAYLVAKGVRADWVHSELTTPQRAERLSKLQNGELDCIVGAQLLREGLDLPCVSLVAIFDADVPGFMRSSRSLMQMAGRASRNKHGECFLFADRTTDAMREMMAEVERRRERQHAYNVLHGVIPQSATPGSATSTLSLFDIMSDEIAAEKDKWAAEQSAAVPAEASAAVDSEAVEKALRNWRVRRAGGGGARRQGTLEDKDGRPPTEPAAEEVLQGRVVAEAILEAHGVDAAHVERLRGMSRDLPSKTGIYRWLDGSGAVLYIGKAKNLRARTSHYLSPALVLSSPRHRLLLASARSLDSVLTPGGEADALALEARMISRERPPLNIMLKDAPRPESAQIWLVPPSRGSAAGRFFVPRFRRDDPGASKAERTWTFPTRDAAGRMMAALEAALDLRGVSFRSNFRDAAALAEWAFASEVACLVLDGKGEAAIQRLEARGSIASALELRMLVLGEAERAQEHGGSGTLAALLQADSSARNWNADVIAAASRGGGVCAVKVVRVRSGLVADVLGTVVDVPGSNASGDVIADETLAEVCQLVAEQMYGAGGNLPEWVCIPHAVADPQNARAALRALGVGQGQDKGKARGSVLRHGAAKRGSLLEALAAMALENADESARLSSAKRTTAMSLRDAAGLPRVPRSIEGMDVSHLAGHNAVTSFVRFDDGAPVPPRHKLYRLSEAVTPSDDYGGIAESLSARLASSSALPDLILVDGGPGQLTAAARVLLDTGIGIANLGNLDGDGAQAPSVGDLEGGDLDDRRVVSLVALAKGRSSGEEALWGPALSPTGAVVGLRLRVPQENEDALRLLRAVRDSAHAHALGKHRSMRREQRLQSFAA